MIEKRILVVSTSLAPPAVFMRGSKTVYSLQKRLKKRGAEVHVLTHLDKRQDLNYKSWFDEQKKAGISFHYFDFPVLKHVPFFYHLFSSLYYILMVIKLHRKYKFSVVHEYSSSPALFYRAFFYRQVGIKKVYHTIQTYNTTLTGTYRFCGGIKYLDSAMGVTHDMVDKIKNNQPSHKDKVLYLPLGLSLDNSENKNKKLLRKKYNLPTNKTIVIYVGPLEESKGALVFRDSIFEISKKNRNLFFLIATYGPEGSSWEMKRAYRSNKNKFFNKIKNISNVRIMKGLLFINELLDAADIFVLPLTTPHGTLGYPAILVESMSRQLGVVASNIQGVNELVINDKTGILVKSKSSQELSIGIMKLADNYVLRKKLGGNARKIIDSQEFDQEWVSNFLYNLYFN